MRGSDLALILSWMSNVWIILIATFMTKFRILAAAVTLPPQLYH